MALTSEENNALSRLDQQKRATVKSASFDIQSSVFFKNNWDTLLIAAPNCLELLGTCMIAASTKLTQTTTLTPPQNGFKYLKGYLSSNLVEVGNQGSLAFGVARDGMVRIHESAAGIPVTIRDLVQTLNQPRPPVGLVEVHLRRLGQCADDCHNQAKAMNDAFLHWLNYVAELHEACQEQSAIATEDLADNDLKAQVAAESEKHKVDYEERAKAAFDMLKQQMEGTKAQYDKAVKDYPSGVGLMGLQMMEAVSSFGETIGHSINLAVNTAVAYVTPHSKAMKLVKALFHKNEPQKVENGSPPVEATARSSHVKNMRGKMNAVNAFLAPIHMKQLQFDLNDPALAIVPAVRTHILALKDIIDGPDGTVDWDCIVKGTNNSEKQGAHAKTHEFLLSDQKFPPSENGLVSEAISHILQDASALSDELKAQGEGSTDLKWKKPSEDDPKVRVDFYWYSASSHSLPEVVAWKERIGKCVTAVEQLYSASKSNPGIPPSGMPSFLLSTQSIRERLASVEHKSGIATRVIQSATAKLEMTQKAYMSTLETYRKANDSVSQAQENLIRIRAEMEKLKASGITLTDVRRVLLDCIRFLIDVKEKIRILVQFFSTLSALVDAACDHQVKPFKESVKSYMNDANGRDALNQEFQIIFRFVVTISAYFGLFRDVASMYLEVDTRYIMPGVKLVDQLGILDSGDDVGAEARLERKKEELSRHAREAESGIHAIVKKKQDEIKSTLEDRINDIANEIAMFPVHMQPDSATQRAIEDGASCVQKVTEAQATAGLGTQSVATPSTDDLMG
ncbi:hypothetical protein PUNSTDRAFT_130880 [Punctularia strigosozonata HHB-11173 SS5]|uniref:uncharacterized protein n=1 Tax=Punctularia strigosozonata (strain HHB-11173) TaxID=741275 RepID=UPI0004416F89|nr:uncharacterized protein PUNSTDRAFT_130880 [Punctularia strigosozonata HHB-11173 SS5]EIN12622.1 hypothetical protein PUNSTDRAFT_130880 [Punctularia strigosozonata HHB-11173 SS5]